jgi:hypothetical protein
MGEVGVCEAVTGVVFGERIRNVVERFLAVNVVDRGEVNNTSMYDERSAAVLVY